MKLKGLHFVNVAEIRESVTGEVKKVQKENFRQLLRKRTTAPKPSCMPMKLILNKKGMCLPHVSSIFKKSVLKFKKSYLMRII
jgi:hypothetical protein